MPFTCPGKPPCDIDSKQYQKDPPGNLPEFNPLDNSLFQDLHKAEAVKTHIAVIQSHGGVPRHLTCPEMAVFIDETHKRRNGAVWNSI